MTITPSSANVALWKSLTQDGQVSRADMEALKQDLAQKNPSSSATEVRQAMLDLLASDSGDKAYADRLVSQFEQGQLTSPEGYQRHQMGATEVSFEVTGAKLQDTNGIYQPANNDLTGRIDEITVHASVEGMVEQYKSGLREKLSPPLSSEGADAILNSIQSKAIQNNGQTSYEIAIDPSVQKTLSEADQAFLSAAQFLVGDLFVQPLVSIRTNEKGELQTKLNGAAAKSLGSDTVASADSGFNLGNLWGSKKDPAPTETLPQQTEFEKNTEEQAKKLGLELDIVKEGDQFTFKPKSLTLKGEKLQEYLKSHPEAAALVAKGEITLNPEQFEVSLSPQGIDIKIKGIQVSGASDVSAPSAPAIAADTKPQESTDLSIDKAQGSVHLLAGDIEKMSLAELNGALKGDITLSNEVLSQIQQKVKQNLTQLDQKLTSYGLSRQQLTQLMSQIPMDSLRELISSAKSGDVEKLAKQYGVDGKSLSSALEFLRQEPVQQIIQDLNTLSERLAVNTRLEGGVEFKLSDLQLQSGDQGFLATLGSLQLKAQAQATTPDGLTTDLDLTAQTGNVSLEGNATGTTVSAESSSVSVTGQTPDGQTISATASLDSASIGPDGVTIQSPELSASASASDSGHSTRLDASISADQIDTTHGNLTVDGAQATADMSVTEADGTQTEASAELNAAQITASATTIAPDEEQEVRDFMMALTKPNSPYIEADGPRKNHLKDKPISDGGLRKGDGLSKETALKELSKATAKEWAEIVHQSKDAQERFFKERKIEYGTYLSDYLTKYVLQPDASGLHATEVSAKASVGTSTEGLDPVDARISGTFERVHAGEQGARVEDGALAVDVTAGTTAVHVDTTDLDIQADPNGLDTKADVNWDVKTGGEQGRISGQGTTTVGIEDSQITGTRTKKGDAQISIEASRQQLIDLIAKKNPKLAEYIRENKILGQKNVDIQIENTRDIVTDANGNLSQYEIRASLPSMKTPYGNTAASIYVSDNGSITGDILLKPNAKFESLIEARLQDALKPKDGKKQDVFLKDVKIEGGKLKIQLEGKDPVSLDLDLSVTTLPNGKIHIGVDQVKLENLFLDSIAGLFGNKKEKARAALMAALTADGNMQVTPDGKYGMVIDANQLLQQRFGSAARGVKITPTLDTEGNLNIRYNIG